MPEISVVIPCYNAASYIGKCIAALESQSYRDFELILVDDCSKDDTFDVICGIREKSPLRIVVLQNEINSGPAASRNLGIEYANSRFITFCDSDDWYDSNYLSLLHSCLIETSSDIVFCGYKVVDEKGNCIYRPISNKNGSISLQEAFCLDADSMCMLMVRTSIMKQTKLPNIRNGEDVATVPLLMAKSSAYAVIDKCPYNYYRRSDSVSETPSMKVVDSFISSFEYTSSLFPSEYREELEYLGAKNMLYASLISLFSFCYDSKKAKSIVSNFEISYPNWWSNPYLNELIGYKKLVLYLAKYRLFLLLRLLAIIRMIRNR